MGNHTSIESVRCPVVVDEVCAVTKNSMIWNSTVVEMRKGGFVRGCLAAFYCQHQDSDLTCSDRKGWIGNAHDACMNPAF